MKEMDLAVFSGTSNQGLAKKLASQLKTKLGKIEIRQFKDGETYVRLLDSVRGKDVFFIQSTCNPVNENLMELILMCDAAKRASSGRINVVMPYYGYARQDRTARPREPISAKVVANLLEAVGVDRLITVDLHSPQIEGFYNFPVDHVSSFGVIAKYFKNKKIKNLVVVAPDAGGSKAAKSYADFLGCEIAIVSKHRTKFDESKATHIVGNVKGKNAIIIDDLISTGGTIVNAINILKKNGAKDVSVAATHGVFSNNALKKIVNAKPKEVVITDTIPQENNSKLKVLTVGKLLADNVRRVHVEKPLTKK